MEKVAILLIALMMISVGFLSGCTNEKTSEEISITSFGVEPRLIYAGETANLTWSVIGATSVTIDNGIGSVSLTGIRIIMPTATTTYTLTASNGSTTKTATTQIIVGGEQIVDGEEQAPTLFMHQMTTVETGGTPSMTRVYFSIDSASADAKWSELKVMISGKDFGVPTTAAITTGAGCSYKGSGSPIGADGTLFVNSSTTTDIIPGMEIKIIHMPSNSIVLTHTIY